MLNACPRPTFRIGTWTAAFVVVSMLPQTAAAQETPNRVTVSPGPSDASGNAPLEDSGDGPLSIDFVGGEPGHTLFGAPASSDPARLCSGHCTLRLDPGLYQFGLQDPRGRMYRPRATTEITRSGRLVVAADHRRGLRMGLIAAGLVAIASAVPIWTGGQFRECDVSGACQGLRAGPLAGATTLVVVGAFAIAFGAYPYRGAHVEFIPFSGTMPPP